MYVKVEQGMSASELIKLSVGSKGYQTNMSDTTYKNSGYSKHIDHFNRVDNEEQIIQKLIDSGEFSYIGLYSKRGRVKGLTTTMILAK